MYVCVYVCMYMRKVRFGRAVVYVRMYTCICVCVCMYACMRQAVETISICLCRLWPHIHTRKYLPPPFPSLQTLPVISSPKGSSTHIHAFTHRYIQEACLPSLFKYFVSCPAQRLLVHICIASHIDTYKKLAYLLSSNSSFRTPTSKASNTHVHTSHIDNIYIYIYICI